MQSEFGAMCDAGGVRFTLYSETAQHIELCLFAADSEEETGRYSLTRDRDHIWSIHIPGLQVGQRYGFRVHGTYAPAQGLYHNPSKLLLDPYARCLDRSLLWSD